MKTQHILLVVGVVVLALLVARFQRSPAPPEAISISQSIAPGDQGESNVLRPSDHDQGPEAPVTVAGPSARDEVPAKPALTVRTNVRRQSSREVSIGLVLTGSNGRSLPVADVVRTRQPPPGLRIVNEAGRVVAQGNFSYG